MTDDRRLRFFKLVAVNALVFIGLLVGVNVLAYLVLTLGPSVRDLLAGNERVDELTLALRESGDARWELPNYRDKELAKRIFYEHEHTNRPAHRYEPFIGWSRLPYRGQVVTVNAEGDRVHAPPPSSAPERKVVRFFGGSAMWGTGAHDDGTIPASFHRMHPDVDVHNHGETAFNSRQGLDRLINLVSLDQPTDVAVFYDGVNEVLTHCREGIGVPGTHQEVEIRRAVDHATRYGFEPSFRNAGKKVAHTVFLRYTLEAAQKLRGLEEAREVPLHAGRRGVYLCSEDPERADRVAEILLRNWEIAHRIVEDRGGRFVAVLQPNAFFGSPRLDHLEGRLDLIPGLREDYEAVYRLIRRKIAERGHEWILDFGDAFDGDEYFYVDFAHVSPNGNEVIARRLAERIGP